MGQTTFSGPVASQNGFIENSFTTAERDAIVDPTAGLLIYNTTTNTYEVYNGTGWQAAFGGGPAPGGTYSAGVDYIASPPGTYVANYGTLRINVRIDRWFSEAAFDAVIATLSGTTIAITVSGETPYTTTLASGFTQDGMLPEQWYADVTPNGGMPPFPTGNVEAFTIG